MKVTLTVESEAIIDVQQILPPRFTGYLSEDRNPRVLIMHWRFNTSLKKNFLINYHRYLTFFYVILIIKIGPDAFSHVFMMHNGYEVAYCLSEVENLMSCQINRTEHRTRVIKFSEQNEYNAKIAVILRLSQSNAKIAAKIKAIPVKNV